MKAQDIIDEASGKKMPKKEIVELSSQFKEDCDALHGTLTKNGLVCKANKMDLFFEKKQGKGYVGRFVRY